MQDAHESADALIVSIYAGETPWAALKTALERKRAAVFEAVRDDAGASDALQRLWYHPALLPTLSSLEPVLPERGALAGNTPLDAVLQLTLHYKDWARPPEEWEFPEGAAFHTTLTALLRHLFGVWPSPPFLDEAWLLGRSADAQLWRQCFLCVATGKRLRDVILPVPLSARGRHFFLSAPVHLSLSAAARWGQLQSLGASERIIEALLETKLADVLPDEPFWESVMHFFINHPELPTAQLGPCVDFIGSRRCDDGAPEPGFSMKGRTPAALLSRVEQWHDELAKAERGQGQTWRSLSLPSFLLTEKDANGATLTWEMVELTDTRSLTIEGSELRHCIRSYATGCLKGERSIFSLRLKSSDSLTRRRMLTIEVHCGRRSLVQVRGRANALPKSQRPGSRLRRAGEIVRLWARERKLGLGCRF